MITRRAALGGLVGCLGACRDRLGEELATFTAATRALTATETHFFAVGGSSQGFLWRVPKAGGDAHAIHDRLVEPRDVAVRGGDVYVATDEGIERQSVHGTQPDTVLEGAVRWVRSGPVGLVWARREGELGVLGGASVKLGSEISGLAVADSIWVSTSAELLELSPRCIVKQRLPTTAAGSLVVDRGVSLATPHGIVKSDGTMVVETAAAAALVGGDGRLAWVDTRGIGLWSEATEARWLRGARAQGLVLEPDAVVWTEAKTRHLRRTPLSTFV